MNYCRILGVAGFLIVVLLLGTAPTQTAASEEPALQKGPYRLIATPNGRVAITIEHEFGPTDGFVVFPVPPDTASQRVVSCELTVNTPQRSLRATRTTDLGVLKKPVLRVVLPGRTEGRAVVKLEIDLASSKLEPGKPDTPPPGLSRAERAAYLAPEWNYEYNAGSFPQWMKEQNLARGKEESDRDFALRLLGFMRQHFVYKIPEGDYMRAKIAERGSGELGFYTAEKAGECWGLSRVYTSVLRANGIPCRQVSGFMLKDGAERRGGHHVRAEVYLEGTGWILVEVAGAVTSKNRDLLKFFGHAGDDMALLSCGVNYKLPGPKGPGNIGTYSGFALGTTDGKWQFPHGKWDVQDRK